MSSYVQRGHAECFLSINGCRELVKGVVMKGRQEGEKGSPVVVTWANYHYLDFVLNWVYHMNKTGCQSYLVGAMDDALLEELVEHKIPAFGMSSGLSLDDFGWGTSTFNKMGREKINLIYTFTKWGFDVIISDVDTVWMKDPIPYMERVSLCLLVSIVCILVDRSTNTFVAVSGS